MRGGARPGAGRKPSAVRPVSATFDVPPDLHAEVGALAKARGLSFAAATREALGAWLAAEKSVEP